MSACRSLQQSFIHDTLGDCSARQSLYASNSGCWRNAPLLLQDAARENRKAKEQMGLPAKRQRVDDAQPDSSSVLDTCLNQFLESADKR